MDGSIISFIAGSIGIIITLFGVGLQVGRKLGKLETKIDNITVNCANRMSFCNDRFSNIVERINHVYEEKKE